MRHQYKLMQMEDTEKIADFFKQIIKLMNSMKLCGETITESTIVEKISRTLTLRFDHIVVAIEESRNIESLKIEELQGSLEAHEQRLNERTTKRHTDQALQAQTHRRGGSSGRSYNKTRGRGRDPRSNAGKAPQQQEPEKHDSKQPESSNGCSNHMTGHKEWLVNFDMKKRSKVKFTDNRVIEAKGTDDVLIQWKDGG
ncbi:hypothetical protein HKD37_03G008575 [Glycine soja]